MYFASPGFPGHEPARGPLGTTDEWCSTATTFELRPQVNPQLAICGLVNKLATKLAKRLGDSGVAFA
jgi:hypothetical protein